MGVGAGLYMYDVVVKMFTFAISSPDEFLLTDVNIWLMRYIFRRIGFINVLNFTVTQGH